MGLERDTLMSLKNSNIVDEYTIIIVEEALDTELGYVNSLGFNIYRTKNYKTNKHVFLCLKEKC